MKCPGLGREILLRWGVDPFDALGLPARFDLDPEAVRRAYLARIGAVHPDAMGEQVEGAAELNLARGVLDDPESRAEALLVRLGGASRAQDKSLPDGFLAEIMEARERIEEALASGSPEARLESRRWADQQRRGALERVGAMFAGLGGAPDAERLRAIRRELNAWRYVERLIEQLEPR